MKLNRSIYLFPVYDVKNRQVALNEVFLVNLDFCHNIGVRLNYRCPIALVQIHEIITSPTIDAPPQTYTKAYWKNIGADSTGSGIAFWINIKVTPLNILSIKLIKPYTKPAPSTKTFSFRSGLLKTHWYGTNKHFISFKPRAKTWYPNHAIILVEWNFLNHFFYLRGNILPKLVPIKQATIARLFIIIEAPLAPIKIATPKISYFAL